MIRSNLVDITQRQFDDAMEREAIEIENYYTHETYKVLFRKSTRGTKSNDSVIIYYSQDVNIERGTMFLLKGEKYLVMTKDALESDVYFTSGALRCNADVIVYEGTTASGTRNAGWYHEVPFVVNTFSGVNPSGSFVEVINGNLSMYTSRQDFLDDVEINNEILDFGGTFEIVNNFWLDGTHNIYLRKKASNPNNAEYAGVLYIGDKRYIGESVEVHDVKVEPKRYVSYLKDTATTIESTNQSVAIVSGRVITFIGEGTTTIKCTYSDGKVATSPTITVGEATPEELNWRWTSTPRYLLYYKNIVNPVYTYLDFESYVRNSLKPTYRYYIDGTLVDKTEYQSAFTVDEQDRKVGIFIKSADMVDKTLRVDVVINGSVVLTHSMKVYDKIPDLPDTDITWTCTDDFNDTSYVNSSWEYSFTCTPSESTDKVPTFKYFFDNTEYNLSDFSDQMTVNTSDPYKFTFSYPTKDLIGYDFYVEAWVDGAKVGQSKTTHFSY